MEAMRENQDSSALAAAALWHERLLREPAEARREFDAWLAASVEHREAYERVSGTWRGLQGAAHDPLILALRHETALRLTRRTSRWVNPVAACAVVLVAVLLGLFAVQSWHTGKWGVAPNRYETAIGERLNVTLQDGTQVTLNSGTNLKPVFDTRERKIALLQGQALFEVAKDAARPFVVEARGQRFIALGTSFDVRVDGERVQLTMLNGSVKVEHDGKAEVLMAGQQYVGVGRSGALVRPTDAERVTAWRRGQVIFENARLSDAIAEVNRYSSTQLSLADPQLADLRLSGAFATGQPSLFVEAVTQYFPVEAMREDERSIVLRARR